MRSTVKVESFFFYDQKKTKDTENRWVRQTNVAVSEFSCSGLLMLGKDNQSSVTSR